MSDTVYDDVVSFIERGYSNSLIMMYTKCSLKWLQNLRKSVTHKIELKNSCKSLDEDTILRRTK